MTDEVSSIFKLVMLAIYISVSVGNGLEDQCGLEDRFGLEDQNAG